MTQYNKNTKIALIYKSFNLIIIIIKVYLYLHFTIIVQLFPINNYILIY